MLFFNVLRKRCNLDSHLMVASSNSSLSSIKLGFVLIKTSYPNLKIYSNNLTQLFKFAIFETQFLFNGKFHDQICGLPIGFFLYDYLHEH